MDDMDQEDEQSFFEGVRNCSVTSGIFAIRCASHGFQLVLKDMGESLAVVASAKTGLDHLLDQFTKSPEGTAKLLAMQAANGVECPKQLLRPGLTRWNSVIDCWWRALDLKPIMCAMDTNIPDEIWIHIEKAVIICELVGVATDRVQADSANAISLANELEVLNTHFISLKRKRILSFKMLEKCARTYLISRAIFY